VEPETGDFDPSESNTDESVIDEHDVNEYNSYVFDTLGTEPMKLII
jgi:hypothetical protein